MQNFNRCTFSENPIVLMRDFMLFPTPVNPFNTPGWLQHHPMGSGGLPAIGSFL